ncbi:MULTISPECIES: hypothetical protein [unclassified Sporosarcina]|uniref:hypothetical protein n=1 Tax=unclassified Sporosarcina TaxID=2647733 RepID=UPI00203DBE5E|nr:MULTISPECIES: hypothetical protein [unclassified Sporosarcina]GKV67112.1 hypothetical protein NCCP2331_32650 [Sporosarcina sp. NCCP-2331]GLB57413.1 hypothetical protein NCCP2378_32010 [Sporosarcina sp. NCCP-2378]
METNKEISDAVQQENMAKNDSRNILKVIGWLNAILALGFIPILLGIVAICMGVVLKNDYDEKKHGLYLIIGGIVGGLAGLIIGIVINLYI